MKHSRRFLALVTLVLASLVSSTTPASADDPSTGRSTEFEAVEGRSTEEVSGFGVMVGSYGLVWLFFFAYVGRIAMLQAKTSAELAELAKQLHDGGTDEPR